MTVASISISTTIAVVAVIIYVYVQSISEPVLVQTKYGQIRGFKAVSRGGRRFNAFRAIPYAKPPVGERRFRPPEEYGAWEGVHDGSAAITSCVQANAVFKKVSGQEDCLILNVYTPNIIADPHVIGEELLPVMVWFHGGHWMHGSSELYGPEYFMDEDVVLVTVNYRLGALGFLNTGDDTVSGNMGLKDQVLALKWVKAAIKSFGGNPNLVTIFGESAGGGIADFHTLSPLSKGLFHRSISQSGTSLCPWSLSVNTKEAAEALAKNVSCPIDSVQKMVECLRGVDVWKIVEVHRATFELFHRTSYIFGPSIENVNDKSTPFLTEHPREILQAGRQATKVPRLFGVTSHEGCYRSAMLVDNEPAIAKLQTSWKKLFPRLYAYDNNQKKHGGEVAEKILKHYFGTKKMSPSFFTQERYEELTQSLSDRYFFKCTTDSALLHAKAGSESPVYMYFLSHRTPAFKFGHTFAAMSKGNKNLPALANAVIAYVQKTVYDKFGWETFDYGNCHVDDILYLFELIPPLFSVPTGSDRYEMSRAMVKAWVAFARDGNPGKFKGIDWTPIDPKDKQPSFLVLNKFPIMIKEPYMTGRKFWESLNLEN